MGYRDLAGFGRRRIEYDLADLRDEIIYQLGALDAFCRLQGEKVRYVKPHGALYNTAMVDVWQASAVVAAIFDYDRHLPLLCQPGSVLADTADRAGHHAVPAPHRRRRGCGRRAGRAWPVPERLRRGAPCADRRGDS